ncbi:MAG: Na+/H+ antiporter NhaA [Acidimicrobiales bacterium]|nr:Na+/H+ antiporter NhaA [Acidimicrobiales bacterium]
MSPAPAPIDGPLARPSASRSWLDGDARLARWVGQPVQAFLAVEAAGGILLVVSALVAVAWASSPWRAGYHDLFQTAVSLRFGSRELSGSLTHWINDGLMTLFFFVVGLEIKREWVAGELRDRRAAALPAIAAVGGMALPAAIYAIANLGGVGGRGWGIPMATDIAFALGVVALLGRRVPAPLKVFLLTLAIVDDIGAIVVIAVFYAGDVSWAWLLGGLGAVVVVVGCRRARVRAQPVYVVLGLVLWFCTYESGVHATIAGVVMALLTPAVPLLDHLAAEDAVDTLEERPGLTVDDVRRVGFLVRESVPLTDRLATWLHPWTSFVIVPLFALANAGIDVGGPGFSGPSAISVGIVAGLIVGKTAGISLGAWLAVRLGIARMPVGVRPAQILGAAVLGGIGFTVSIFVAGLAFGGGRLFDEAKAGILVASVLAAVVGSALLAACARRSERTVEAVGATSG